MPRITVPGKGTKTVPYDAKGKKAAKAYAKANGARMPREGSKAEEKGESKATERAERKRGVR